MSKRVTVDFNLCKHGPQRFYCKTLCTSRLYAVTHFTLSMQMFFIYALLHSSLFIQSYFLRYSGVL